MPRLSPKCVEDIHRYIELRYSHWEESERKDRIRKTIRALKRESVERQVFYSEEVEAFFNRHADVIADAEAAKKLLGDRQAESLLVPPSADVEDRYRQFNGDGNEVLRAIRGSCN